MDYEKNSKIVFVSPKKQEERRLMIEKYCEKLNITEEELRELDNSLSSSKLMSLKDSMRNLSEGYEMKLEGVSECDREIYSDEEISKFLDMTEEEYNSKIKYFEKKIEEEKQRLQHVKNKYNLTDEEAREIRSAGRLVYNRHTNFSFP